MAPAPALDLTTLLMWDPPLPPSPTLTPIPHAVSDYGAVLQRQRHKGYGRRIF